MPPSLTKGVLIWALDLMVGVAERAIELIGDPDLRDSIERDRRALRAAHDHLVETLREVDGLELTVAVQRRELDQLREEVDRLQALVSERGLELTRLQRLADARRVSGV